MPIASMMLTSVTPVSTAVCQNVDAENRGTMISARAGRERAGDRIEQRVDVEQRQHDHHAVVVLQVNALHDRLRRR